ncbi:hypothetical protein ACH4OY_03115 [Micromonospora rubida]|uniref:Uncharacterized protein n=1 Tax=Micromonospora rubida TaxID=2697657 RepID=A0ABW7SDC0_9ACTN
MLVVVETYDADPEARQPVAAFPLSIRQASHLLRGMRTLLRLAEVTTWVDHPSSDNSPFPTHPVQAQRGCRTPRSPGSSRPTPFPTSASRATRIEETSMPNYPIPYSDDDQRLNDALLEDVRTALLRRGFPELTKADYGMLEVMLVRFVYAQRREISVVIKPL